VSLLFQVRVVNGVLPTGDYSFAKYNKVAKFVLLSLFMLPIHCYIFGFIHNLLFDVMQSVDIIKYTDEEYEKYLTDPVGNHV
jgi:DNA methyltransferase 1-associated protein 1